MQTHFFDTYRKPVQYPAKTFPLHFELTATSEFPAKTSPYKSHYDNLFGK